MADKLKGVKTSPRTATDFPGNGNQFLQYDFQGSDKQTEIGEKKVEECSEKKIKLCHLLWIIEKVNHNPSH